CARRPGAESGSRGWRGWGRNAARSSVATCRSRSRRRRRSTPCSTWWGTPSCSTPSPCSAVAAGPAWPAGSAASTPFPTSTHCCRWPAAWTRPSSGVSCSAHRAFLCRTCRSSRSPRTPRPGSSMPSRSRSSASTISERLTGSWRQIRPVASWSWCCDGIRSDRNPSRVSHSAVFPGEARLPPRATTKVDSPEQERVMARIVRFHKTGGPEVLQIENVDAAPRGKGAVQTTVKALGLNRAESMSRSGQYLEAPKLPARLGYEAAGTVAAVGPGVEGFKVGDVVSTIPAFSLNQYGLYGDLANAPVHAVTHHPASLSFVEAAAVWMQSLTAYGALIDIAKLGKGDTVLIPAASSSVGLAAIQIANRVGAVPVALTRGSSKRQALLDAGAAHVVATEEQDLVKEVLGITGGKGARVVFGPVGGPTVNKLVQATARLGIVFLYGALSTEPTPLPLFDVLSKWVTIRGYVLMEITSDPERLQRGKEFVNSGLAD